MVDALQNLLTELEQFGRDNDSATAERPRKMLNITRDTGEFLAVLVRAALCTPGAGDRHVEWLFDAMARERGAGHRRIGDHGRKVPI